MKEGTKKKIDLGSDGKITFHLSDGEKRLLIKFDCDPKGLTKAGVGGLIDGLKRIRDKMRR
jgi:hypothetical protein